jgi:hypothetical protein
LWGEGLREEAGRALSDGRVAVAGWLLAGWEPVLLIDPGGDGKQEIRKYFLQEFIISVKNICTSDSDLLFSPPRARDACKRLAGWPAGRLAGRLVINTTPS